MPRDYKASENQKRAKARRSAALTRPELRQASVPRQAAAGATSFPVKKESPSIRAAVDAFLSRQKVDNG